MPAATDTGDQLRQRAAALRSVATLFESSAALDLYRRAGDDVWQGPTPQRCLEALLGVRRSLVGAAVDLRARARDLDLRAAQLDGLGVR